MPEIINVHSALPLNKQVEQYLRRLISQDEYRQGKMLPTELALPRRGWALRATPIRAAMDKLVREGPDRAQEGRGRAGQARSHRHGADPLAELRAGDGR